jgi:dihydrofolate reductase
MAKLTFGMMASLDGYINDRNGDFDWGHVDEDVHRHANAEQLKHGVDIYGRRMYETMAVWETYASDKPFEAEFARIWRETDKIVVSKSLSEPKSKRTRIVRSLSTDDVRRLKVETERNISVSGPTLAAGFLAQGLVDEVSIYYVPIAVGGGTPLFKDVQRPLTFERIEEQPFRNGVVFVRYRARN